jgi:hypothetical protein
MSDRLERLALVEAIATLPERIKPQYHAKDRGGYEARKHHIDCAMYSLEQMIERLRELLPDDMRIGDYLANHKQHERQHLQRLRRPARRIYIMG